MSEDGIGTTTGREGPRRWRTHWRWAVPGTIAAVVVGGVVVGGLSAGASGPLPPRTAEELLTDVQSARVEGLSGTVVQSANLGLPDLDLGGGGGDLSTALAGTHTWRVWYGGPDKARLALIDSDGETNIIRNGDQVWTWNSTEKSAVRTVLPEHEGGHPDLTGPAATASPQETSAELLKALDPTTRVSTDGTAVVAGRDAYTLVLDPRSQDTLVRQVRIAVDAEEKVPLRVQVMSTRIQDPAFEVGFTSVDFSVPEDRQFQFTPPEGTQVSEAPGLFGQRTDGTDGPPSPGEPTGLEQTAPTVVGQGWSTVVVGTLPAEPATGEQAPAGDARRPGGPDQAPPPTGVLEQLPQRSGAWGTGRVLEGTVFTAIVTDDGRYAVGAVPVDVLETALAP